MKVSRNTSAKGNESPARPAPNTRGSAKKTGQQANRKELGVEGDHRTPAMRKGHRGTFP